MVDLLTVIPIWVTALVEGCPHYSNILSVQTAVLYVLCGLNTTRILRALRIHKQLIAIEDAVERAMGVMALTVVVMLLFSKSFE